MGQHLARMLHQHAQDIVFFRRQLDLAAIDLDDALDEINRQATGLEQRSFPLLLQAVAERDADARHQFVHAEGLRHIVIGAQFQRRHDPRLVGPARQDDDRQRQALLAPSAQQIMAGHIRQSEIEQDQVGQIGLDAVARRLAVAGLADGIILRCQTDAQQPAYRRLIIDNKDFHR